MTVNPPTISEGETILHLDAWSKLQAPPDPQRPRSLRALNAGVV